MKRIILMMAVVLSFKTIAAQQQNQTKTSLPIKISLKEKKEKYAEIYTLNSSVYVEGYDGDELVIESYDLQTTKSKPAAATSLKDVTKLTIKDNLKPKSETFITEFPDFFRINVGTDYNTLRVKAPRNMHLKLSGIGSIPDNKISMNNLSGKLEVSGSMPLIDVNNVSGPITVASSNTGHTKIKIQRVNWDDSTTANDKFTIFVSSYSGSIDISVPQELKATFNLRSNYGEVYSDLGIKPKFPESNTQNYISSQLNGGGTVVSVTTEYGNIFVRKEK